MGQEKMKKFLNASNRKNKISFRQQRDMMDCGASCLSMMTSYFGNPLSIDFISSRCGMTSQGVSMHSVSSTAKALGFETAGVKTDINGLTGMPLPCILHWNQNHFVILSKISKRKFEIVDPEKVKYRLTKQPFHRTG